MKNAMKKGFRLGLGAACALGGAACGDDGAAGMPWEGRAHIIGERRSALEVVAPSADECLEYDGADACVRPQDECGDGVSSDVILGADGEVLDIVCYPADRELSVDEVEAQQGDIAQNQNKAVIHLDDLDDGVDLEGDLSIDANKVIVYGAGPALSVISGNVRIDGNNIIVHGVRIQGDVEVPANNAYFVDVVIEGNLTITGNNAKVASSDVLGTTTVAGNNAKLTADHFAGALAVSGKNARCVENLAAIDANDDASLTADELGEPLSCAP